MLVIGRKRDEKIIIDGNIEITILKVGRNHVKFGVTAPKEVSIETRTTGGETPSPARREQTQVAVPRKRDASTDPEPAGSTASAASRGASADPNSPDPSGDA